MTQPSTEVQTIHPKLPISMPRALAMRNQLNGWGAMARSWVNRLTGGGLNTRRHRLYDVFGWDQTITASMLWEAYQRGGIARRIVDAYPDDTWGAPPKLTGRGFTTQWEQLEEDHNIWSVIHRLDRLSQLGQYAVLLVGTDRGNLQQPLSNASRITFLQPLSERSAVITRWGNDPSNERFGLPVEYTVYPGLARTEDAAMNGGHSGSVPQLGSYKVHWSRVIHYAQGQLENEVFGVPLLWSVWNYLTDLQKITGGSAESYWLTANRGMQANVEPDMDLDPDDEAALTQEIEEYHQGLRRFIRTRGVEVKSLGSDVADPTGPYKANINLIAGTTGIPQRILLGSESAHQASTQDKGAWAEQVENYRVLTAGPSFLKPTILGLQRMGLLAQVRYSKIKQEWPDAYRLSPLELGQRANQRATALNNIGLAAKNAPNLMTVEEGRDIVGLPEQRKGTTKFEAPVNPAGNEDDQLGDGGSARAGPGSGTTATPGSDANENGDAVQGRKATNQ